MRKLFSLFLTLVLLISVLPLPALTEEEYPVSTSSQTLGRELIVSGSCLWQVVDQTLRCTDFSSTNLPSELPLSSATLPVSGELYRFNLLSSGQADNGVRLMAAFLSDEGSLSIQLLSFTRDPSGQIRFQSMQDWTEPLGAFYAPDGGCLQVEMTALDHEILLSALDEDFICHLCLFTPETGIVRELSQIPYSMLTAVLPRADQILLAGDSLESGLNLSVLSLTEEEISDLADYPLSTSATCQNFALDPSTDRLFFTLRNTVYRVSLQEGTAPEPIAVLHLIPAALGKGAIISGNYVTQTEAGDLLSCPLNATLSAIPLRILNTTENTDIEEITARFNAAQPEYFLSVETLSFEDSEDSEEDTDEEDETPEQESAKDRLTQADAVISSLSSPECQGLLYAGYSVDLSVSSLLQEALASMEPPVRRALEHQGTLIAFPISLEVPCLTLNLPALEALTGLTQENLPRDWQGFLSLLSALADQESFRSHPEYSVSISGLSPEDFSEILLFWMLRSVLLDASYSADSTVVDQTLPPLLNAFKTIHWQALIPEDIPTSEDSIPIVEESLVEITTGYQDPDKMFWPLSAAAGRETVLPQQLTVLLLNAASPYQEILLRWVEYAWQQSDPAFRMSLCSSLTDPIPNEEYESTLAELEQILQEYEAMAKDSDDPDEVEAIRAETESLRDYLASYRAEAMWLVSAESLASYRSHTFAPDPIAFWESEDLLEVPESWLAGDISDEALLSWARSLLENP